MFLVAVLVPASFNNEQDQLDIQFHSKLTVGRTVSSLYNLRDLDDKEGAFFVFSNISIRQEGSYRLKMCLFDITEYIKLKIYQEFLLTYITRETANYQVHVFTEAFTVYSAKSVNFHALRYRNILIIF